MTIRTDELLQRYLDAESRKKAAETEISELRKILDGRGRRYIAEEGAAPTWKVPGSGTARIDGYGASPRVIVSKERALAEYLAGVSPSLVEVSIRVPADRAGEALAAVRDWADVQEAEVVTGLCEAAWNRWSVDHVRVTTDETGELVPQHVDVLVDQETGEDIGYTVVAPELPGTQAVRPAMRLVVALDTKVKAATVAAAKLRILQVIADADDPQTDDAPQTGDPQQPEPSVSPPATESAGQTEEETPEPADGLGVLPLVSLRAACRDAGLPVSGTKQALIQRLRARTGA